MFKCQKDFPKDVEEKILKIIQTDTFKEINDIANICDLSFDEKTILQNIKDYIYSFLSWDFDVGTEYFLSFFEAYKVSKKPCFDSASPVGELFNVNRDLLIIANGYHIYGDYRLLNKKGTSHNGLYSGATYLGTDGNLYLSKRSMLSKQFQVTGDIKREVDYNPIMAEEVFNFFDVPVAKYYLLRENGNPYNVVLTKNFLKPNQELIHLEDFLHSDKAQNTYHDRIEIIMDNLKLRYKHLLSPFAFEKLCNKIKLEYCKQEFLKQLIGPMDSNTGNTAFILTQNGAAAPDISLSPAYDLDISFNISDELVKKDNLRQIHTSDNQPVTIESVLEEFKEILGFKEFLMQVADKISSTEAEKQIVDAAYARTNLGYFKEHSEEYIAFLNNRFKRFLKCYKRNYLEEMISDETLLGR